jgi:transposase
MDEVWWSRFALPSLRLWQNEIQPICLTRQLARADDVEPKALACYGLWCARQEQMLLRFVDGRPVSHVTTAFLEWATAELAAAGEKVLVLIWDNASWHVSGEVRNWIAGHNQQVKSSGAGVRIIVVGLPTKSPWLNNIEPKWAHGKKAIVEPARELSAAAVEERVCAYFGTIKLPHLVQLKHVRAPESSVAAAPAAADKHEQPLHAVKTQEAA